MLYEPELPIPLENKHSEDCKRVSYPNPNVKPILVGHAPTNTMTDVKKIGFTRTTTMQACPLLH